MRDQHSIVIPLRGISSPRSYFLTRGFAAYLLTGGTVFCAVVLVPGLDALGEAATWSEPRTWGALAACLVLGLLALFAVQRMIRRAPRQFARYECVVSTDGLGLIRHRKGWAREERARMHWSNIHSITTETLDLPHRSGSGRNERREYRIITLLLYQEAPGIPDFRHYKADPTFFGVDHPVHAVDITGDHSLVGPTNQDLEAVAEAIDHMHPGLFRRGIRQNEWFPPGPAVR